MMGDIKSKTLTEKPCLTRILNEGFKSSGTHFGDYEVFALEQHRICYNHVLDCVEYSYKVIDTEDKHECKFDNNGMYKFDGNFDAEG